MENNLLHANLKNNLIELINWGCTGLKAEFAAEGATFNEVLGLKNFADNYELDFSLKIGGVESKNEIQEAKILGIKTITVPMVESVYAAAKYIETLKTVFSKEELKAQNICINIETITSLNILGEILNQEFAQNINGIIFGRSDMACSLNMTKNAVNTETILNLGKEIAILCQEYEKELTIGGNITPASVEFFEKMYDYKSFKKFETRKVVFDKETFFNLSVEKEVNVINLALEFEKNWKAIKSDILSYSSY